MKTEAIINKVREIPAGRFFRVRYTTKVKLRAEYEKKGYSILKIVDTTTRTGVKYKNIAGVKLNDYPDEYEESIKPILERVDICLSNGLEDAVNKLHQQIRDWRKDIDTPDIVCDDEAAGCLFCKTQVLRNVLLELSEIDKCFKEEDTTGCAKYLFCDFLKCVDANHWHTNNLF